MRLSSIDLNLLVVFAAIHDEGSITRAASKLHLSQPAVSHSLARLRELFGDALFVRSGNAMVPTPLAKRIASPVREALHVLEHDVLERPAFDPSTAKQRFHVGSREVFETSWLPPLAARLRREAPGVELVSVRVPRTDIESELASGKVDVVLDVPAPVGEEIRQQPVLADRLVVVARKGNPRTKKGLDLEAYLASSHILVSSRRRGPGLEDVALARLGHRRRVELRCQSHVAALAIVGASDLLLTMPELHASNLDVARDCRVFPLPFDGPPIDVQLYWHESRDDDPASVWLRERLVELAGKGPSAPSARTRARARVGR